MFPAVRPPSPRSPWSQFLALKLTCGLILALVLRLDCWAYESQDFLWFLQPWYEFIQGNDRFFALKEDFFNYNPTYIYLLILGSYVAPKLSALTVVKAIGVLLDLAGAYGVYCWAVRAATVPATPRQRQQWGAIAAVTLLLVPTVILNGSYWGQCDMGYTAAVLAGLYGLGYGAPRWGLVGLTVGVALKLQAAFTFPVLAVLLLQATPMPWLGRNIPPNSPSPNATSPNVTSNPTLSWRHLWVIPVAYGATLVPAAIAGHPWLDLLTVYWRQFNTYDRLTLNAPSIYQWFPQADYATFTRLGLIFTAIVTLLLMGQLVRRYDRFTPAQLLQVALGFNLLLPWLLPKMHDRYLFCADILALTLAFLRPRFTAVAVATIAVSLGSYAPYLLGREVVSLRGLAVVLGLVVVWVWWDLLGGDRRGAAEDDRGPDAGLSL